MTAEQRRLVEEEDKYRRLFAEEPNSQELQDSHVLLEDVFSLAPQQWTFQDEDADEKKVAKLLEQKRQPVTTGRAIVDTMNQFLTNWDNFTKGMFKGLNWDNIFVAGGSVLACLQPDGMTKYPNSDIDIFVYGIDDEEKANNLLKHVHSVIKNNTNGDGIVIRTRRTVTIINSYPYRHTQVILRLYKSPAQVLLGFDVDCCTFGFDGKKVWAMERGRRALTKRYNLVNPSRRSLTYESRLFKYSKRGFAVAVPGLDRSRINQKLFGPTSTPSQFQGLAKLLVYDHRASNPIPLFMMKRGQKGQEEADEAKSDYDGDLVIPWGPGLTAAAILHRLNATDKSQFFANKMKSLVSGGATATAAHKHLFVPGLDDLIQGQFWCTTCAKRVDLPEDEPLGIFVQRKVEWDRNALSYQDIDNGFRRNLFTGSFQVQLNDNWALGAYQDSSVAQQASPSRAGLGVPSVSVTPSSFSAAQLTSPSRTKAVKAPSSFISKKSPVKAKPTGAIPSFYSSTTKPPSPAKKQDDGGQASCNVCGSDFISQNQLYRHARLTGHSVQTEATPSVSSSSSSGAPGSSSYVPTSSYIQPYKQPISEPPSSPARTPAPVTIPISPSQIYSTPTPLETPSSSSSGLDLSQFGPQPGSALQDIYYTMPPSSSSYSPPETSNSPPSYSYSPPDTSLSAFGSFRSSPVQTAYSYSAGVSSGTGDLPWEGKDVKDEMTKTLLLLGWLKRQHKIDHAEREKLKRLAIEENEVLFAAVQVYEIERDEEDLVHTLQRIVQHARI